MLTRVYIDNYKCFVNCDFKLGKKQLIMGRNGAGKSTLLEAIQFLLDFAVAGIRAEDFPLLSRRTRWLKQPDQTWELEAQLNGDRYNYKLIMEPWGDPVRPRVQLETVHFNGQPIFEFAHGEVHLYNDQLERTSIYPFDPNRSALATIQARVDNKTLIRFVMWLSGFVCFRIDPFSMESRASSEHYSPLPTLRNFATWYRRMVSTFPVENAVFLGGLRDSLDGFDILASDPVGGDPLLYAKFGAEGGHEIKVGFHELSDGQRCLICLYAILQFLVRKGHTVILDEPDNFISLRELQPWLMEVSDVVEKAGQVLLISHHPEFINQWAASNGLVFFRDNGGPVQIEAFTGDSSTGLAPAELVARGWEHE
jgi:predicted ATPase